MNILGIYSETTCGEACWMAHGEICKCSCGGKNHGIYNNGSGIKPLRMCKINGDRYVLQGVGQRNELSDAAKNTNVSQGLKQRLGMFKYYWQDTDNGAPAKLKTPTKNQKNWTEVKPTLDNLNPWEYLYLLWVKEDVYNSKYDFQVSRLDVYLA